MQDKNKKEQTDIKEKAKKKDTIFAKYVKDRIFKKNKNFFMIIVGSLGEGKSTALYDYVKTLTKVLILIGVVLEQKSIY